MSYGYNMVVKFRKLNPDAITPTKAHYHGDAGFDLIATNVREADEYIEYATGIAIEIPNNYVGLLFPRGSISKYDLLLTNSVGVIDSGYRGEIFFRYKYTGKDTNAIMWADPNNDGMPDREYRNIYKVGEKVGQLVILELPYILLEEVYTLEVSERGEGRFGSTGR